MDILPSGNIFRELLVVHDTGYLSAQTSLEDHWEQVRRLYFFKIIFGAKKFSQLPNESLLWRYLFKRKFTYFVTMQKRYNFFFWVACVWIFEKKRNSPFSRS